MTKINSTNHENKPDLMRGYIEGYYGRLLTWNERGMILNHLSQLGMGYYLYAPKEDPCHRFDWRQDYDQDWMTHFQSFCAEAKAGHVDVIAGVAPGIDFDFAHLGRGDDWNCLIQKCRALITAGADQVALLLDDIQPDFDEKSGAFTNEAEAHAVLANTLNKALSDMMKKPLIMTPRIYADEIMGHDLMASGANDDVYWPKLAENLDAQIMLLVCGKNVVSHDTSLQDTAMIKAGISAGRAIIWDNLYAHDYCPRRLFLGPWKGRLDDQHILLNPTGMTHTDMLLLSFMEAGDDQDGWHQALSKHGVPEVFLQIAPFFDLPPRGEDDLAPPLDVEKMLAALDMMLWQWKSPLQREWYPYLMGLRQDILLKTGQMNRLRARKSLPPLLWPDESDEDV